MPLSVHLTGPSGALAQQVVAACAAQNPGTPYAYNLGSTLRAMLLLVSPPKNMKVDIEGDNDDLTVSIHPV